MSDIAQERCFNHRRREAVACCPECHRFFCRECITEHGGRVICAVCLRKTAEGERGARRSLKGLVFAAKCLAGLLVLWIVFYYLGQSLLLLPTSFHEGTLWRALPWEVEE